MDPFTSQQLPTIPNSGRIGLGSFSPDPGSMSKLLDYYRNLIQLGQLDPGSASKSLEGDYVNSIKEASQRAGAPGYAYGGSEWQGIQSRLFSPMKVLQNPSQNMQGRQGDLTSNGGVKYENPYLYKSITGGGGSVGQGTSLSGMTNAQWIGKPVVPYSGPKPTLSGIATPNLYK